MTALVVQGDACRLPLPDGSVDLIVTSPPYYALRSYTDGCPTCADTARAGNRGYMERYCPSCGRVFTSGRNKCHLCDVTTLVTQKTKETRRTDCPDCGGTGRGHYAGQIGSEQTPAEYLDALWACTREWMRVLKPEGSIFVNLGDKYSGAQSQNFNGSARTDSVADTWARTDPKRTGIPNKSLMGIPWRYAIGCIDRLGLILRAEIIWSKPNGLPESVTDRVRRSHEQWFHLVRQPRYYSAVDEVRETHDSWDRRPISINGIKPAGDVDARVGNNPLGKLPGSVWSIPSEPLQVPDHVGVDHFAAFPTEWPRRLILGWSPPGICMACGQGRRPVVDRQYDHDPSHANGCFPGESYARQGSGDIHKGRFKPQEMPHGRAMLQATITGYACACDTHPWIGNQAGTYHCEECGEASNHALHIAAPTRPALILDPFGGTGTTALVAHALGRVGISVDMSWDYCSKIAKWRTTDRGELAKAMRVEKPKPVPDGQMEMFA